MREALEMNKEERLIIWRALSELFLDNELDALAYQSLANTVQASGLATNLVEQILWQEVFPVLEKNLSSVAGVWDGWSDDWLLANLTVSKTARLPSGSRINMKVIEKEWAQVCAYLPTGE